MKYKKIQQKNYARKEDKHHVAYNQDKKLQDVVNFCFMLSCNLLSSKLNWKTWEQPNKQKKVNAYKIFILENKKTF